MMRIGQGFDVHRFDPESGPTTIRLGGIDVPAPQSLLAHSDGDVALHAVCDALLGAAALGDIGEHFPDNSPRWAGVDSRHLLTEVYRQIVELGFQLVNLDITIIAQTPRLGDYKGAMKHALKDVMQVQLDQVNVKATTTETLGFTGRKEGIAVQAVCLLERD